MTNKSMRFMNALAAAAITVAITCSAQQALLPAQQTGNISGTAMDAQQEVIPAAKVALDGPDHSHREVAADDNGAFTFDQVASGGPYRVSITAPGFTRWTSPELTVTPGQFVYLSEVNVPISGGENSIVVSANPQEIAVEQVNLEVTQRAFGFIPNFYVAYNKDAAPLPARLKFKLALKAETDPITFLGVAFISGIDQAAANPDYPGGMRGYGQRLGANYTTGFTDIMFGGAILPTLLHQDPRYFYQGSGSKRSRFLHAIATPVICRGDNGRWQPNYSSIGGDLISSAISESYYPQSNRGSRLVLDNALIAGAGRAANGLVQEFVMRRFTSNSRVR